MNVGPTGAGEFDCRAKERLADYGKWLHENGDAIYGCTRAPAEFAGGQIAGFAQGDKRPHGGRRQAEPLALQGDAGLAAGEKALHRLLQAFGLAGGEFGLGKGRRVVHDEGLPEGGLACQCVGARQDGDGLAFAAAFV